MPQFTNTSQHKPLRVLFVSPLAGMAGGAEHFLYSLIEHLPRERITPEVLAPLSPGTALKDHLSRLDVRLHTARFRTWLNIRSARKGHLRLFRLLDNLRVAYRLSQTLPEYDLIYSNSTHSPIGAMIAMFRRKPHIWHIHENLKKGTDIQLDWNPRLSMLWAQQVTQAFICVSEATKRNWSRYISQGKLRYIRQAILKDDDFGEPRVKPSVDNLKVCVVGRISPGKNQQEAIQALKLVTQDKINAQLLLAGSSVPEYEKYLRGLAANLGLSNSVSFLGYVSADEIYRESDIHLVTSTNESAPLVILESMARGCPTISSDFDGASEFIIDGFNGLLYPLGQAAALAQRIIDLYHDHERYARFSAQGIAHAREHFMLRRIVREIVEMIEEVVSGTVQ